MQLPLAALFLQKLAEWQQAHPEPSGNKGRFSRCPEKYLCVDCGERKSTPTGSRCRRCYHAARLPIPEKISNLSEINEAYDRKMAGDPVYRLMREL